MKFTRFTLFLFLLLATGCAHKSTFFQEDLVEQSIITNTKKGQLFNSLEIKATITATYLNGSLQEYKNVPKEMFLISIYIDNDSSVPAKSGIYNVDYELTLDGEKPTAITELDYHDDLIKKLPARNHWSHYYLVGFDKQSGDMMKMHFKNRVYGEQVLRFRKAY